MVTGLSHEIEGLIQTQIGGGTGGGHSRESLVRVGSASDHMVRW
jgi:hypothetical protein